MSVFKGSPKLGESGVSQGSGAFDEGQRAAAQEIDTLQKKISALIQKVELVEAHSKEYFRVLHEKGWNEVVSTVERLELVSKEIDTAIRERRFSDALELARYVANPTYEIPEKLTRLSQINLREFLNWELDTDTTILAVATDLGAAAQDTKNLGIERAHKRQPTLVAVQEIKRLLTARRDSSKSKIEEW